MNFRRYFVSHAGAISVILLGAILAVLVFAWMGYDYGQFADEVMPASKGDALSNSWAIYQAMDNVLHRPLDLGYSPTFYGDPAPFAYTIAPYGIAAITLPAYLLSGRDLELVYNLYYLFTFVLTAWAMYLLIRYLLAVSQPVGVLMALSVAFAQYRFGQIWHVETLSAQFYLLALYGLHRLIETPRARWSVGLALAFWLTMTTSGYLGMAFLVTAGVIGLVVLLRRPEVLTRRVWAALALAAVMAVVITWPFMAFRLDNGLVRNGYSLDTAIYFSAEPLDWLSGTSFIYNGLNPSPIGGERDLFLGFVPLLLAYLGWRWRGDDGGDSRTGRVFSSREVVFLYTLIVVTGYVLSLGPVLKINDEHIAPLPYMLLFQVPGISSLRVPTRFIVLAIVGIGLLGSVGLARLQTRLTRPVYAVVFALLALCLAVELIPTRQSRSYRLLEPGVALKLEPETLYRRTRDQEQPVHAWLADLPRDTVIFHYPASGDDPAGSAVSIYSYEQRFYGLPIVNGWGSYLPRWFGELAKFPDLPILYLLNERGARYVVVHNDYMPVARQEMVAQQIETLAGQGFVLPLVATVGGADVYDLAALRMDQVVYGFDTLLGTGWSGPEMAGDTTAQWTTAREASLTFPALAGGPLMVQFRTLEFAAPDIADSLTLAVNGVPVTLKREGSVWQGIIPLAAQTDDHDLRLVFHTDRTISSLEKGTGTDARQLGVRFDWLNIAPLPTTIVWEFSQPSPGTGWHGPEMEGNGVTFEWTSAPEATLILLVAPGKALKVEFRVIDAVAPEVLDSLTLTAGGAPVALDKSGSVYSGVIAADAVTADGQLFLAFHTDRTASPSELGRGTDTRQLGVRLDWLRLTPGE